MEAYAFPVHLQPIRLLGDLNPDPIPGAKAIVRTDTQKPLSIVSDSYHLFTHSEAVETTKKFLAGFGEHQVVDTLEKDGLRFVRECTFKKHGLTVEGPKKLGDVVNFRLSIWNSYDKKSSVRIRVAARVLKCLNGMTVEGGSLDLSFRHTGSIRNLELPEPDKVMGIFTKAGERWNDWASERVTTVQRDSIVHHALERGVIGERILDKHDSLLNPDVNADLSFWQYFNNFTNVITHHLPKVQLTAKIVRLDRLNTIFNSVLYGTPEPGFINEENE